MYTFALLLALLFKPVVCPTPAYSVRATGVAPREGKTCGATTRMLKDRHRITTADGVDYVNGMRWANMADSAVPGEAYLAFHQGQKVWLTLWFVANDRKLIGLYALNGPDCQDVVRIEGRRL